MTIMKNIRGTLQNLFRIGLDGPTIYQDTGDPTGGLDPDPLADGLKNGDLYIRIGNGNEGLFQYRSATWEEMASQDWANSQFLGNDPDVNALAATITQGFYVVTGSGTSVTRRITGTSNQIGVTNSSGLSGNTVISFASNPIIPGTNSITIPAGTSVQQPAPTNGMIRYDTTLQVLRAVINSSWANINTAGAPSTYYVVTDSTEVAGPVLTLERISGDPAIGDQLGEMVFIGRDELTNAETYARFVATINSPVSTLEEGGFLFYTLQAGTERQTLNLRASSLLFSSFAAGALVGPDLVVMRNKVPATNDVIGSLRFRGKDNATNDTDYASLRTTILNAANGSEAAELDIQTFVSGASASRMVVGQGVRIGSPTGSDKGVGTLNATGLYVSNVSVATTGANTFTALQTISGTFTGVPQLTLTNSDPGASGVLVYSRHLSASPAASDVILSISAYANNATPTEAVYGLTDWIIGATTIGAHRGIFRILPTRAGVQDGIGVQISNGMLVGAATGSFLGDGTVNATGLYVNNVAAASIGANTFTATQTITSTDASNAIGPFLILDRNSASPAALDSLGSIDFIGRDSQGTPASTIYARDLATITTTTDTAEAGTRDFHTMISGTLALRMRLGSGLQIGAPTGTDKGAGTINAAGVIYQNNVAVALAEHDLAAVEAITTFGHVIRTALDTWTTRTLAAPLAGFTITDPTGVAGDPTFVLANDLAAVEGLSTIGYVVRTATDTWTTRTLTAGTGITISNPTGTVSDPTIAVASTVPLLASANIFTANQSITTAGSTLLTITSTAAASTTADPALILYRNATGSGTTNLGGYIQWQFKDDAAALFGGVSIIAALDVAAAATRSVSIGFYTVNNNSAVTKRLTIATGLSMAGTVDPGAGKINATDYLISGTSLNTTLAGIPTLAASNVFTGTVQRITSAVSPELNLYDTRNTTGARPFISFDQQNSSSAQYNFARIRLNTSNITLGSETAQIIFQTAQTNALATRVTIGAGLYLTGSDPGAGVVNATDYWISGTSIFGTANTFTAAQSISTTALTAILSLITTEASATSGPKLRLYRNSSSPLGGLLTAGDNIGNIQFTGQNSTPAEVIYGQVYGHIISPTGAAEYGEIRVSTIQNGAQVDTAYFGQGLYMANSLTDPGTGKVNATDYQINGVSILGSHRNLIIGGDFSSNPWQRGTSFAGISGLPSSTYTADRWLVQMSASAATFTVSRSATGPTEAEAGYHTGHSLSVVLTAIDTITTLEYATIGTKIEGYNIAAIYKNPFTLSFWVWSNKTGTYCVAFRSSGADMSYTMGYTISSASTWEKKTITVSASPTGGTWDFTTGVGMEVRWCLFGGNTSRDNSQGTWQAADLLHNSSQAPFADTNGNEFRLALVQLEPGITATPFVGRTRQEETLLCQRYYCKTFDMDTAPGQAVSSGGVFTVPQVVAASTSQTSHDWQFPIRMRVDPTIVTYNPTTASVQFRCSNAAADCTAVAVNGTHSQRAIGFTFTTAVGSAAGHRNMIHITAEAEL